MKRINVQLSQNSKEYMEQMYETYNLLKKYENKMSEDFKQTLIKHIQDCYLKYQDSLNQQL